MSGGTRYYDTFGAKTHSTKEFCLYRYPIRESMWSVTWLPHTHPLSFYLDVHSISPSSAMAEAKPCDELDLRIKNE